MLIVLTSEPDTEVSFPLYEKDGIHLDDNATSNQVIETMLSPNKKSPRNIGITSPKTTKSPKNISQSMKSPKPGAPHEDCILIVPNPGKSPVTASRHPGKNTPQRVRLSEGRTTPKYSPVTESDLKSLLSSPFATKKPNK